MQGNFKNLTMPFKQQLYAFKLLILVVMCKATVGFTQKLLISVPPTLKKGKEVLVTIFVREVTESSVVKLVHQVPDVFEVNPKDISRALFQNTDNEVKILWMHLPLHKISVASYSLEVPQDAPVGFYTIKGFYTLQNKTKKEKIRLQDLTVEVIN